MNITSFLVLAHLSLSRADLIAVQISLSPGRPPWMMSQLGKQAHKKRMAMKPPEMIDAKLAAEILRKAIVTSDRKARRTVEAANKKKLAERVRARGLHQQPR
jgi:hypothetical protein